MPIDVCMVPTVQVPYRELHFLSRFGNGTVFLRRRQNSRVEYIANPYLLLLYSVLYISDIRASCREVFGSGNVSLPSLI